MLDERKAKILDEVVAEYIETAQPVGSGHVAKVPGIGVSPATVRNEMAALEQEGYLHQPHTSAGRVPTEKGYRFFVDRLGDPHLGSAEARQVRSFFAAAHGELEQMLADTSRLLTHLTSYAGVVIGPPHEAATIRSVQLVGLAPTVVLVVVVLSNGVVEKHTLELDAELDDLHLNTATGTLAAALVGRTLADASRSTVETEPSIQPVVDAAIGVLGPPGQDADGDVYIGGTATVADAFDAVGQVRQILHLLEEQIVVVSLLQDLLDRGLSVAIGTETGLDPLAECAVIVAPYAVDGEQAGSIGVLGPSRMNYPQALAAVAVVSQRLGKRLSEG